MADSSVSVDGQLRRFVLEHHPVRAFWTRLEGAWQELRALQRHSPPVEALLGETVTAAVLLAATLKFRGTLSLQLQGRGLVRLLVAQCTHDFQIRAVARINEDAAPASDAPPSFADLVGRHGSLAVTIEAEERSARYQGVVALEGESLAECLEAYFATSEQLPTRIALSADAAQAAGVLLQKMPGSHRQGEGLAALSQEAWEQLQQNLAMLPFPALQSDAPEPLLQRICGEHDGRLFAATAVRFVCRCSRRRVAGLLRALGAEEIHSILAEQGAVTVTCEFCGRPYRFDAIDAQRLFADGAGLEPPASVN